MGAVLGPENQFPVFRHELNVQVPVEPGVPKEDCERLGWGITPRVLPYRLQDDYNRDKQPRAFRAWALENEFLRAVIVPELGGRVVSLVYKDGDRELVARNPVFQPVNAGVRNAWFSGGIEWNPANYGHSCHSCSPVYAGWVSSGLAQAYPVLRLYEWDRIKCVAWQVDLHLPPESRFLFARVRLINAHEYEVPVWWGTHVAVAETPGLRMLGPADSALCLSGGGPLAFMELPEQDGVDLSYPARAAVGRDLFLRIPVEQRSWIALLDQSGRGFVHVSTNRLPGRMLRCYGSSPGGRRWQEFLSEPGHAFVEVQAGLARTNLECLPIPAGAHWSWTEAFGLLEADPAKVHSRNWHEARSAADTALNALLPPAQLEILDQEFATTMTRFADSTLLPGSGWGALERRRLAAQHKLDNIPPELVFLKDYNSPANDASALGPDQEPWVQLLEHKGLPDRHPNEGPGQFMVQNEWRPLLEQALAARRGDHWLSWYHLGNLRFEAFDYVGAREAWLKSLKHRRTSWVLRNLALLQAHEEQPHLACELLHQAWESGPKLPLLADEYARCLRQIGRHEQAWNFIDSLPDGIKQYDSLRLAYGRLSVQLGRIGAVERLLNSEFPRLPFGDATPTEIWFGWHERRLAAKENAPLDAQLHARVRKEFPPPPQLDFRLYGDQQIRPLQPLEVQPPAVHSDELSTVVAAWPHLPENVKKQIVALALTAKKEDAKEQ